MKSIDQKLIENKYKFIRRAYLQGQLAEINERIARETQTMERLKKQLEKESDDVKRLEQTSLNRIFSMLSGRSEIRLEKEKAEALRAALDCKLKEKDLDNLRYQKNLLEQELKPYESLAQEYQGLLDIKRKSLESKKLNEIRSMEKQLDELKNDKQKIKTVKERGKKLCSSFVYLLDNLSDLVEDGSDAKSLWYPVIMQDQMEDMTKEIAKLNELWQSFTDACKEAHIICSGQFDQSFLLHISDSIVSTDAMEEASVRINTSFEHLHEAYGDVRERMNVSETRLQELEHGIYDLKLKIRESIEID